MKKFLIYLSILFISLNSFAGIKYVVAGAAGNGSAWNNAYGNIPTSGLVCGDVVYVAGSDTSYPVPTGSGSTVLSSTCNDSGNPIIINKATLADHGSDVNWNVDYANKTAKWIDNTPYNGSTWGNLLDFCGDNVQFNGKYCTNSKDPSTCGFYFSRNQADVGIIGISRGCSGTGKTGVTAKYVGIDGVNPGVGLAATVGPRGFYIGLTGGVGAGTVTLDHIIIKNAFEPIAAVWTNNLIVTSSWIDTNFGQGGMHSQALSLTKVANLTFQYNQVWDIMGTAYFTCITDFCSGTWTIDSNVFGQRPNYYANCKAVWPDAVCYTTGVVSDNAEGIGTLHFTGNTISQVNKDAVGSPNSGIRCTYVSSNCTDIRNNVWYNSSQATIAAGHDYNDFINTALAFGTTKNVNEYQSISGDPSPFVDVANDNVALNGALPQVGTSIAAPYNVDILANTRGADGVWDAGAYEFNNNNPVVSLSATSHDFGEQANGVASAPYTITLTNTGGSALNIASISAMAGTNPADFTRAGTCAAGVIAAGNSCTLIITFTPGGLGARSANFTITDDAAGSPRTINLSGTGTGSPLPTCTITASVLTHTLFTSYTINIVTTDCTSVSVNPSNLGIPSSCTSSTVLTPVVLGSVVFGGIVNGPGGTAACTGVTVRTDQVIGNVGW